MPAAIELGVGFTPGDVREALARVGVAPKPRRQNPVIGLTV